MTFSVIIALLWVVAVVLNIAVAALAMFMLGEALLWSFRQLRKAFKCNS